MSDLWLDFLLAAVHHVLVFGLFVILALELAYARPGLSAVTVQRLGNIDGMYGVVATLIVVVGFSRAIWGVKGWDYYATNPLFWMKITLFVIVGLLSALPTIAFLRWNRRLRSDGADLPSDAEVKAVRRWLHAELGLIFLIPIVAAAMARGLAD